MMSFARRGPATLRSLRLIPSVSTYSSKILRISSFRPERHAIISSTRAFSSIPRYYQEAAVTKETEVQNSSEYTEFAQLAENGIIHPIIGRTINNDMNIHTMTEVQRMTLNSCLDGSDVIAQAKTGTGKTLAFLTPIVQRLLQNDATLAERGGRFDRAPVDIRALLVSPTRELAEQIAVEASRLVKNTSIKVQTAVGGTGKTFHLRKMQREGCHLLIGTPGRIIDLLSDRNSGVSMDNIETFVLDEADRLLDIGFSKDIEEMQRFMPPRSEKERQTLMFSATVPKSVIGLVRSTMRPDFKFVRTVDPNEAQTHERIPQKVVFMHGLPNQLPVILDIALQGIKAHQEDPEANMPFKAIVYFGATTQIDMAYKVFTNLRDPNSVDNFRSRGPLGNCRVYRMNGGMSQEQRTRETENFRRAESAILFSTDVTARGMDFPNVSHVIQLGLPRLPDDYIHRLGRTGRAGKPGQGWLLLNEDEQRDFGRLFKHQGIQMQNEKLESASLDMSRAGQVSAATAQLLQAIELGVKTVSYDDKARVYRSLLGVMQQQFPGRGKQEQIDMMNELARFGWGMQTPPALSRTLVNKLGYGNVTGIEYEAFGERSGGDRGDRGDRGGRGGRGGRGSFFDNDSFGRGRDRDGGRGFGRNNDRGSGRNRDDPFSSDGGKGVFGGRSGGGDRGYDRGRRDAFGDY